MVELQKELGLEQGGMLEGVKDNEILIDGFESLATEVEKEYQELK